MSVLSNKIVSSYEQSEDIFLSVLFHNFKAQFEGKDMGLRLVVMVRGGG